ncbi:MAG: hypothetical protein HY548_09315 [Elusimicrobia bacterium]|nr:hypothetical protein [Elusimicrobiota bacterium]
MVPYTSEWTEPEKFLEYKGVSVYCTYRGDDMNLGRRIYWFTVDPLCGEETCGCEDGDDCWKTFDVRDIALRIGGKVQDEASMKDVIMRAIDRGLITAEGIRQQPGKAT